VTADVALFVAYCVGASLFVGGMVAFAVRETLRWQAVIDELEANQ